MNNSNDNTNDKLDLEKYVEQYIEKVKKSNYSQYIKERGENDEDILAYLEEKLNDELYEYYVINTSFYSRINSLKREIDYDEEKFALKSQYEIEEKIPGDLRNKIVRCAENMFQGESPFDETLFYKAFELMTNDDVLYTLSNEDYNHLLEDKETVLKMMEKSGLALEIAVALPDSTIKQLLTDKELLSKALNKEIIKNSNLTGSEIVSSMLVQLLHNDELTNDKDFMIGLMNDLVEVANGDRYYMLDEAMTYILSKKCDDLFKEKDFSKEVLNLYENMGCLEYSDYEYIAGKIIKLSDVSHDKELALKYAEIFSRADGIDKELLEDEEFIKQVLENTNIYWGNIELPEKYYSNPDILREYIQRKYDCINKLNFDLDNENLKDIFMEHYCDSMESYMRDYIKWSIEQNKEIVVSGYDESVDYGDVISAIQQWAEDEDLIKIGEKIHVVNKPEGEIIKGKLNIVTGENVKNSITEGFGFESATIVLNGYKFADIIKQLGIDTRIDMDKIQNQYDEMIESLKQKCEETKIMPHDVIDVVRNADIVNNGENCINMKKDDESGKTKAVLSIAHPIYFKKYQDVELDGEELKEIIELANNNSYEDAQRKLEEIAQKGIGEISTTCNYATLARFEYRDIKPDVIGTIGEGTKAPYLIGRKELSNGEIPDFKCIMPYETIYYKGTYADGIGKKFIELEMNENQVKEFNHKEKEIDVNTHSYRYGRADGYYRRKVYDIPLNGEIYHLKTADWTNGGSYIVMWKGDDENYPEEALGISGSHSEWASSQCGVDETDIIRFIKNNPNRVQRIVDANVGKCDCCGLFPTEHIESLCVRAMHMPTESELIIDNIQNLASKKADLQNKERDAKKLLEQYEELNGNKNKSEANE